MIASMAGVKRNITTAIVALAVASVVHADMMPLSPQAGESRHPCPIWSQAVPQQPSDPNGLVTVAGIADSKLSPVGLLPRSAETGVSSGTPSAAILTDGPNSLTLCLYALFSLGLCKSAPWVKRLSLVMIPEWYYDGRPWQIGHSFALLPDCHCPTTMCFIQPDALAGSPLPQYARGMIVFLWRESQCSPTALTSRGPPKHALRMTSRVPSVA